MICPNCKSENTQFVTKTTSNGPSFSKGCCGWLIFGPIGILCSLCGTGSETQEYWICNSCGKKFYAGDYESKLKSKNDKVAKLKQDIESLEEDLQNKPENLSQLIDEAKAEYDIAKEAYDTFNKEFINSSSVLKFTDTIDTIVAIVSFIIVIFGIFVGITSLGDGGFTIAIISVVIGIALYGIMQIIFNKVKMNVDAEKANQLKILENERDAKNKRYKDLQEIQRKEDSHSKKLNELDKAEQDLNNYQSKQDNNQ